jgi:hypothetical protein
MLPQILLYQRSGFIFPNDRIVYPTRFLLPALAGYSFLAVSLLRSLRWDGNSSEHGEQGMPTAAAETSPGRIRHWTYVACMLILWTCVGTKLTTAYASAEDFARYANRISAWFDTVKAKTTSSDTILIVFSARMGPQRPVRLKVMLNVLVGDRDLTFYPFPRSEEMEVRTAPPELWEIASSIRIFDDLDDVDEIDVVVLMDGIEYELGFLQTEKHWFRSADFTRYEDDTVAATYFRSE